MTAWWKCTRLRMELSEWKMKLSFHAARFTRSPPIKLTRSFWEELTELLSNSASTLRKIKWASILSRRTNRSLLWNSTLKLTKWDSTDPNGCLDSQTKNTCLYSTPILKRRSRAPQVTHLTRSNPALSPQTTNTLRPQAPTGSLESTNCQKTFLPSPSWLNLRCVKRKFPPMPLSTLIFSS